MGSDQKSTEGKSAQKSALGEEKFLIDAHNPQRLQVGWSYAPTVSGNRLCWGVRSCGAASPDGSVTLVLPSAVCNGICGELFWMNVDRVSGTKGNVSG